MELKELKKGEYVFVRYGDEVVVGLVNGTFENLVSIKCDISALPFVAWGNGGNILLTMENVIAPFEEKHLITEAHENSREAMRLAEKVGLLEKLSDGERLLLGSVIAKAYLSSLPQS